MNGLGIPIPSWLQSCVASQGKGQFSPATSVQAPEVGQPLSGAHCREFPRARQIPRSLLAAGPSDTFYLDTQEADLCE